MKVFMRREARGTSKEDFRKDYEKEIPSLPASPKQEEEEARKKQEEEDAREKQEEEARKRDLELAAVKQDIEMNLNIQEPAEFEVEKKPQRLPTDGSKTYTNRAVQHPGVLHVFCRPKATFLPALESSNSP